MKKFSPSVVRLGRLLELIGTPGDGEAGARHFRRRLLEGFVSLAGQARDDQERRQRLALFEEVLRKAGTPRSGGLGSRLAR